MDTKVRWVVILLIYFIVYAGYHVESKKNKRAMIWWPYSIVSRPVYKWVIRRYKYRILGIFATAIPGSLFCYLLFGGWFPAMIHQIITPLAFYSLHQRKSNGSNNG